MLEEPRMLEAEPRMLGSLGHAMTQRDQAGENSVESDHGMNHPDSLGQATTQTRTNAPDPVALERWAIQGLEPR
jgi:hypothetical protein